DDRWWRRLIGGIDWRTQTGMSDGVRVLVTAKGPEPQQQWSHVLREGQVARVGRRPTHGWAIPWDDQLAPEHVELSLENGRVTVRRLPETPVSVWLGDEPADEFILGFGGSFRLGKTTIRIQKAPAEASRSSENGSGRSHMFGKYKILKKLGAGGMGQVYLALDTEKDRQVALKILDPEKSRVLTFVRRFQAEAEAASHLHHENIVAIYESGSINGKLFMALEYVDGIDVERLLEQKGPLSVRRSLDIVKQVARALQHAYEQGIVHRDIKPSNLMITREGLVKLTDMGLARSMDDTERTGITRAGTTVGTVDYMSPEQARDSKAADTRSDIYSLGCAWYHMLTGRPPYPEGSITNKLHAHATSPIPDPREKNPEVPEALVAVLRRMMAKSPEERYQTPAELLEDLENVSLVREEISTDLLAALADGDPAEPCAEKPPSVEKERTAQPSQAEPAGKPRRLPPRMSVRLPRQTTQTVREPAADTEPSRSVSDSSQPASSPSSSGEVAADSETTAPPSKTTKATAGMIRLRCPGCGRRYKAKAADAGKRFRCPHCGTKGVVPKP
ncbi:MAG: protein kinase, partial [Planctomycetes bacterium]|nr:protein kinase [Planctomycetota bacterium]